VAVATVAGSKETQVHGRGHRVELWTTPSLLSVQYEKVVAIGGTCRHRQQGQLRNPNVKVEAVVALAARKILLVARALGALRKCCVLVLGGRDTLIVTGARSCIR
jgi:hypothetical protein